MFSKMHKAINSWTFTDKMPPVRTIVSDCNTVIDSCLKPCAMEHLSFYKTNKQINQNYYFVDKIAKLFFPDECLLITLDVSIDHPKGLHVASEAVQFLGHLYDGIMEVSELSLKITNLSLMENGTFRPLALQ